MGNEKGTVVAAITPSGCFILVRITIYLLFGARATSPPREAFVASTGKPGMSFLPPDSPSVPRELSRVKKNFSQPPNHSFSVLRYRRVVYFIMKKYMKLKEIEGAARKNGERSYGNVENCVVYVTNLLQDVSLPAKHTQQSPRNVSPKIGLLCISAEGTIVARKQRNYMCDLCD